MFGLRGLGLLGWRLGLVRFGVGMRLRAWRFGGRLLDSWSLGFRRILFRS